MTAPTEHAELCAELRMGDGIGDGLLERAADLIASQARMIAELREDVDVYEGKLESAHHQMAANHARATEAASERDALRAELATARPDLEAARRDADRYRWLRGARFNAAEVALILDNGAGYKSPVVLTGDKLDREIDASLAQKEST